MTRPIIVEINCQTGEETTREFNDAEMAQFAIDTENSNIEKAKREAEAQAKADAKLTAQAKLQALGLTGDEIAAITE